MNATAPQREQHAQHDKTPPAHSDDKRSDLPERDDRSRKQSPADRPGTKPGEGEPPVG